LPSKPELEAALETRCVAKIEARGGLALKLSMPGVRGFPDRTILTGGFPTNGPGPNAMINPNVFHQPGVWFAEFKRAKTGRRSAQQDLWAKKLGFLGHRVYFIDTDADFDAALEKELARG
jgi:hypothetical protein